jgi:hypothetical protein
MGSLGKFVFLIVIITLLLLAGPWLSIWAINTLIAASMAGAPGGTFVPQIAFHFWTWLAAVLIGGFAILPTIRRG